MSGTDGRQIVPSGVYVRVVPGDTTDLKDSRGNYPQGISLGGAGTLRVRDVNGTQRDFVNGELALGIVHPIRVTQVHATGTTATFLRVYY